jgi:hypothetical protein
MSIPLAAGARNLAQFDGTLWIDNLQLGTSSILNQIFSIAGQSIRGQTLTVHPTAPFCRRASAMTTCTDTGQNPVNFRGSIGLMTLKRRSFRRIHDGRSAGRPAAARRTDHRPLTVRSASRN